MTGQFNDRGYQGCFADEAGTYVYFVPDTYSTSGQLTPRLVAYDTRLDFFDQDAWGPMGSVQGSPQTPSALGVDYVFGMSFGGWNWLSPASANPSFTQKVYRWPTNPPGRRVQRWQSLWIDSSGRVGVSNAQPTGYALDISGATRIRQLAAPATPTVSASPSGTFTWGYRIIFVDAGGNPAGGTSQVTVAGAATLDGTAAYNTVSWSPPAAGVYYATKVYRTIAGTSPSSTGLIGTTYGGATFFDVGQIAGVSFTAPPRNATGDLNVAGAVSVLGYLTGTVDQITYSAGTTVAIDPTLGNLHIFTVTGATAVTITPLTLGVPGQHMWLLIHGYTGATATVNFSGNFKSSGAFAVTQGKGTTLEFWSNGAFWWEHQRTVNV